MRKILLFFAMFFMFSTCVFASHLDLVPIDGVYSSQYNINTGEYFSSNQKKYLINGEMVYCVEPGKAIMTREYSDSSNLYESNLSGDILNRMSLIGHFGYDYPNHQTDNYFLAAQELIWELLGDDVHFTTGINDTGVLIDIENEKNEILNLVNSYYTLPSFDGSSLSGIYQDEIVLVDINNVLSDFVVTSTNNDVVIDGNKLIVKLNSLGSDTITLTKKYDDKVSMFYHAPNSQDFMFLRANDTVTSSINVEAYLPSSKISIVKTGEVLTGFKDKFIYEEKGLTGVVFGLYAADDIYEANKLIYRAGELVEKLVTKDGKATSENLPNGNYYLKELETIDGYILDTSEILINLSNYDKEIYTYDVKLSNERQKILINLQKNGEDFTSVVDGHGEYKNVPLEGIKFGLYSSNPIYSYDGSLLVDKDVLIKTLVTDSAGMIKEELDIPFGVYYLKELETLEGYKLDPNIYEFSVLKNEDNISIFVTKEPIVNELVKSRLVIYKIDEDGNYLSNARFKIFDEFDNLIYEGVTDSNGMLVIDDLPYGKYHFLEVSAPDGYLLDDRLYEFVVYDDNELIEIKVKNDRMPVTSNIYYLPKKLSAIGLGFGVLTLSFAVIYDKKHKIN